MKATGGTVFNRHTSTLEPPWWYIISPPFSKGATKGGQSFHCQEIAKSGEAQHAPQFQGALSDNATECTAGRFIRAALRTETAHWTTTGHRDATPSALRVPRASVIGDRRGIPRLLVSWANRRASRVAHHDSSSQPEGVRPGCAAGSRAWPTRTAGRSTVKASIAVSGTPELPVSRRGRSPVLPTARTQRISRRGW